MLIKIEQSEAKNIINFYLPKPMVKAGNALLFSATDSATNEFVGEIFEIGGVNRLLVTEKTVSIKYDANAAKEDIKALVMASIDDYLQNNVLLDANDNADNLEKCEAVADALIRPTLNRDNGDITINYLSEGVVEVQFTGHCAGCPYAHNTLQNVIIRTFRQNLPQIKEVKLKE